MNKLVISIVLMIVVFAVAVPLYDRGATIFSLILMIPLSLVAMSYFVGGLEDIKNNVERGAKNKLLESLGSNNSLSNTPCPHCGKKMVIKEGQSGKFLACPEH